MYSSLLGLVVVSLALIAWSGRDARAEQRAVDSGARKFDEYVLEGEQRWTRLDRFVKQLRQERGKRAYIIVYARRKIDGPGVYYDGEDWKMWVYQNLKARRISEGRFTTVNGGLREHSMIELWIVGSGATPPVPTPTATETVVCPSVSVLGSIYVLRREQPLSFRTQLSAWKVYSFPNVTFQWTVSSGRILKGQGTDAITVDASQSSQSRIEATVKVAGLPGECGDTDAAATVMAVIPHKFDEFGSINFENLMARLDNLAFYVQNNATLRAHIIVYGGRYGRSGEASAWGTWMKEYLVNTRGLGAERLVIADGGYREERSAELWLVPWNHSGPAPTPTMDPKDVVHEKRSRKPSRPK